MTRLPFLLALFLAASVHAAPVVFTVDSVLDLPDAMPGDGTCGIASGQCTLRAALMEVQASAVTAKDFEVRVPPGDYMLSHVVGDAPLAAGAGDLDIGFAAGFGSTLVVTGWENDAPASAARRPVIRPAADFPRRLLSAFIRGNETISLHDLVFQSSRARTWAGNPADQGGALYCTSETAGAIDLQRVAFVDNQSEGVGGAVFNYGCALAARDTTFEANCGAGAAFSSNAPAAAPARNIFFDRVSFVANTAGCLGLPNAQFFAASFIGFNPPEAWALRIENSTFAFNKGGLIAIAPIGGAARTLQMRNVTMSGNTPSHKSTDALYVGGDMQTTITHSTLGMLDTKVEGPASVTSLGQNRIGVVKVLNGIFVPSASDLPLATDAALGPLSPQGAYTQGFTPRAGSVLIDAGNPSSGMAAQDCAAVDQAERTRPLGIACDIGAIESTALYANGFE